MRPRRPLCIANYLLASKIDSNLNTCPILYRVDKTMATKLSAKPPFSGLEAYQTSCENPLTTLQLNVEDWTSAKREVLHKIAFDKKATVIFLQETHHTISSTLQLHGYTLADWIPHRYHGIAAFVLDATSFTHEDNSAESDPTEWSTISSTNSNITNLYHPPFASLDTFKLPSASAALIISGDLNCHRENWGYSAKNSNGNYLASWYCNYDLQVPYNREQLATFKFSKWHTSTNPDITFCTSINGNVPEREVLIRFPQSQHRPSLIKVPSLNQRCESLPIPRWNFRKANWNKFKETTKHLTESLAVPSKENINQAYQAFTKSLLKPAKQSIPRGYRKSFIPMWYDECSKLFKEFQSADNLESA